MHLKFKGKLKILRKLEGNSHFFIFETGPRIKPPTLSYLPIASTIPLFEVLAGSTDLQLTKS